ncbi:hypothetical protein [Amycolatopsis kentuckyensis]|uniref:hypothetical protein n=1 Tax=Amycolatopsis kentuckyensis TaxID=218823 RepID=UPI000A3BD208|nr:hypothetical protein [Amycolatopsis kentuckyensis]
MTEDFGFPFGCVAAVAAVIVADLAGATSHPWYALVTLGAVVLAAASRSSPPAATGVAVISWGLHTGFVLGRFGELTFDPGSGLAALVLASALAAGLLGRAVSTLGSRESTSQTRVSTFGSRESTSQTRVSSVPVREPSVRVREFAGRVLRAP